MKVAINHCIIVIIGYFAISVSISDVAPEPSTQGHIEGMG
jgi:hypothetical protein